MGVVVVGLLVGVAGNFLTDATRWLISRIFRFGQEKTSSWRKQNEVFINNIASDQLSVIFYAIISVGVLLMSVFVEVALFALSTLEEPSRRPWLVYGAIFGGGFLLALGLRFMSEALTAKGRFSRKQAAEMAEINAMLTKQREQLGVGTAMPAESVSHPSAPEEKIGSEAPPAQP